jgi:hypothetical protein
MPGIVDAQLILTNANTRPKGTISAEECEGVQKPKIQVTEI